MGARAGLYGKLPARRDFVTVGLPRAFVALWDPWLQRGLAAGRAAFGTAWLDGYLAAPIWRFRLGPELCGFPVLGALMASVDGAGRCFPLTLAACGPPGGRDPAPDRVADSPWFTAVEDLLLSSLDEGGSLEAVVEGLGRLPDPNSRCGPTSLVPTDALRPACGEKVPDRADEGQPARLPPHPACRPPSPLTGRRAEPAQVSLNPLLWLDGPALAEAGSLWWTVGGPGAGARAFAAPALPAPMDLAAMLGPIALQPGEVGLGR